MYINCGVLPLSLIEKALSGIKIKHNNKVYVFGRRITYFNGLRVSFVPYLVKNGFKTDLKELEEVKLKKDFTDDILDKIKLDSTFKPKIDKSKFAGLRACVGCGVKFKVYFEVKSKVKRLVSDKGVLVGGDWACLDCYDKVFNSEDLNKMGDNNNN